MEKPKFIRQYDFYDLCEYVEEQEGLKKGEIADCLRWCFSDRSDDENLITELNLSRDVESHMYGRGYISMISKALDCEEVISVKI